MARLWQSKGKKPHLEKEYWKIQSQNIKLQISWKLYPKTKTPPPLIKLPLFIVSKTWEIPLNHYLQLSNQRKTNSPNYQHTNSFSFTFFCTLENQTKVFPLIFRLCWFFAKAEYESMCGGRMYVLKVYLK